MKEVKDAKKRLEGIEERVKQRIANIVAEYKVIKDRLTKI